MGNAVSNALQWAVDKLNWGTPPVPSSNLVKLLESVKEMEEKQRAVAKTIEDWQELMRLSESLAEVTKLPGPVEAPKVVPPRYDRFQSATDMMEELKKCMTAADKLYNALMWRGTPGLESMSKRGYCFRICLGAQRGVSGPEKVFSLSCSFPPDRMELETALCQDGKLVYIKKIGYEDVIRHDIKPGYNTERAARTILREVKRLKKVLKLSFQPSINNPD